MSDVISRCHGYVDWLFNFIDMIFEFLIVNYTIPIAKFNSANYYLLLKAGDNLRYQNTPEVNDCTIGIRIPICPESKSCKFFNCFI